MKRYLGIALSPVPPWYRTDVAVEFSSGYMVITTPEGRWLGSWPAVRVTAEELGVSRVQLTLGDEDFAFDFEDPSGLLEALEAETHYLWKMTAWEKLVQVLRVSRMRFVTPRKDSTSGGIRAGDSTFLERVACALRSRYPCRCRQK